MKKIHMHWNCFFLIISMLMFCALLLGVSVFYQSAIPIFEWAAGGALLTFLLLIGFKHCIICLVQKAKR